MARLVFLHAAQVRIPPAARLVFLLDAAVGAALVAWGVVGLLAGSDPTWPLIRAGTGALVVPAALASAAGSARARLWRRRAMYAGIVAVAVAGGRVPATLETTLVILWHGALLVAQLVAARETSRAVSAISGEEGMPEV